jgi:hypothetical protein
MSRPRLAASLLTFLVSSPRIEQKLAGAAMLVAGVFGVRSAFQTWWSSTGFEDA